jgi:hypothetical protein
MWISLWNPCARFVRIRAFHAQDSAGAIRRLACRKPAPPRCFSRSARVPRMASRRRQDPHGFCVRQPAAGKGSTQPRARAWRRGDPAGRDDGPLPSPGGGPKAAGWRRALPEVAGRMAAGAFDGSCGSGVRPAPEASGGVLPGTRAVLLLGGPGNLTPPFFRGRRLADQPPCRARSPALPRGVPVLLTQASPRAARLLVVRSVALR